MPDRNIFVDSLEIISSSERERTPDMARQSVVKDNVSHVVPVREAGFSWSRSSFHSPRIMRIRITSLQVSGQ